MESLGLYDLVFIVGSALAGATLIAVLGKFINQRLAIDDSRFAGSARPVFLFDGDSLSDTTPEAQNLVRQAPSHQTDRQAVLALFRDKFPTLEYIMAQVAPGEGETIIAADDSAQSILVEDVEGMVRLTLNGATTEDHQSLSDSAIVEGLERETTFLREVTDTSPHLIWSEDLSGRLTWANAAYMSLFDRLNPNIERGAQVWPDRSFFADAVQDNGNDPERRRAKITLPQSGEELWFDLTSRRTRTGSLHFASDAQQAVLAETSKSKAMQTSGRLFANLATGLAIFDQRRQLAIFNPRLVDLTRLEPQFLTKRPTVDMFLDALRESRVLPEPKNYASWREQFSALEDAARAGTYCENWDLIDGQTFRVTGKPYEDKSFVFMFDDITAEVNLTRRFRTDIETGQGVMDAQDHAIAVFSANGTLVQSNRAYKRMWDSDHDNSMTTHQLRGEIANWQTRCAAAPAWGELRNYIAGHDRGKKWVDHLILDDGRDVMCEAQGLNANMTMVSFKAPSDQKISPVIHKLTMTDPSLQSAKR